MKVKDLFERLRRELDAHEPCRKTAAAARLCLMSEDIQAILNRAERTLKVGPKKPCKYPHFAPSPITIEVERKPPTWINRDGEEVIIASMTPAHLANTIDFVRRVRTERGEAALADLEVERNRRVSEQMKEVRAVFEAREDARDPFF